MKKTVSKKLPIAILVLVWALVGCQSEVDKCVNSLMKRDKYENEKEKNEYEAMYRVGCLKAQSGK